MVTIYDIAQKANVSAMTVSRVINNKGRISAETKEKVERAIRELNYIPNGTARSLVSKSSRLLSLLITDVTNPFFTSVVRGAEDKARQMGYQILLSNSDEDVAKESEYIKTLISTGVDGVLLAPTGDDSAKNARMLIKYRLPFVLIDREIRDVPADIVLGDNVEGTRKLMRHLVDAGHTRIALINGPFRISTAREREKGYREALQTAGLTVDERLIFYKDYKLATQHLHPPNDTGGHKADDRNAIAKLMAMPEDVRPTAIFAANNFIAVHAVNMLREHGIRVPEDMAVVCFDELSPIRAFDPFFTVAAQPAYDFGYIGTQLLIERIEQKAPAEYRRIVLPPEVHLRRSSQDPHS